MLFALDVYSIDFYFAAQKRLLRNTTRYIKILIINWQLSVGPSSRMPSYLRPGRLFLFLMLEGGLARVGSGSRAGAGERLRLGGRAVRAQGGRAGPRASYAQWLLRPNIDCPRQTSDGMRAIESAK